MQKTPAELVIKKFGGVSALADALGIRAASVSYWLTRGKGRIPSAKQVDILRAAHKRNIHLTAHDLVLGA